MSYESPDGDDMDAMNELNEQYKRSEQLLAECRRIINPFDVMKPIATAQHIKVLLKKIDDLKADVEFLESKLGSIREEPF